MTNIVSESETTLYRPAVQIYRPNETNDELMTRKLNETQIGTAEREK